jgi:gamma-D-glutamyl-L-lysine dipeptidyl-peptidase
MTKSAVCLLPAVPVRSGPSHQEEMVTQMIFGEHAVVIENRDKWILVEICRDGYQGWVHNYSVSEIPDSTARSMSASSPLTLGSMMLRAENRADRQPFHIPAGSLLYDYEPGSGNFSVGGEAYTCLQEPFFFTGKPITGNIVGAASQFLKAPYLWGGKTGFGIDCSGLTQVVYSMFGIKLPRNSRQQVNLGKPVAGPEEATTGDLAFFENEQGRIIHTGIVTGDGRIIHASGMVRIDRLDQTGIYNDSLGTYTHRLQVIKSISEH